MMEETLETKVGVLENEVKNTNKLLVDLRDNHFNALKVQMESLRATLVNRLPVWATIVISLLSSSTVGLAIWGIMVRRIG